MSIVTKTTKSIEAPAAWTSSGAWTNGWNRSIGALLLLMSLWVATPVSLAEPNLEATSTEETASGFARSVLADCSGATSRALVRRQVASGRLAMYVYQHGRLVASGYATQRLSGSTAGVVITSYQFGSVLNGGASLRIRAASAPTPATRGYGHLTYAGSNELVDCAIF